MLSVERDDYIDVSFHYDRKIKKYTIFSLNVIIITELINCKSSNQSITIELNQTSNIMSSDMT